MLSGGGCDFRRLALATSASGPEPSIVSLAMMAGLSRGRVRIQHFRTRACPTATEAVSQVTGLPGRHLDAWLMPPEVCRGLFTRGAFAADLSVVEGTLGEPDCEPSYRWCDRPGQLDPIATILDLPIVAVIRLRDFGTDSFHLPWLPTGADAVFIDGLSEASSLPRLKRLIHLASGLPVIGALDELPPIRRLIEELPREGLLSDEMIAALAHSFWKYADLEAIDQISNRPFPDAFDHCQSFEFDRSRHGFRVAYAHDEAFGRYFPDTLEALESLGADLVEFSPLRDEGLPEGADLIMIGCGIPDQYADLLASNVSMISALRGHVCRGRRIYSEGGGTAYLGRNMIIDDRTYTGAGIFPFNATLEANPEPPAPVTRTLLHDSWLGPRGSVVRGYRSNRWSLTPALERFECPSSVGELSAERDWFFHHHAVGSLLHLHLGALPEVVHAFAGPHSPSLRRPSPLPPFVPERDEVPDRDEEPEASGHHSIGPDA